LSGDGGVRDDRAARISNDAGDGAGVHLCRGKGGEGVLRNPMVGVSPRWLARAGARGEAAIREERPGPVNSIPGPDQGSGLVTRAGGG
jgi:hypothetical protein